MREGWQIKELGEIADIEYGFTDKATTEGDFRYIRITDIDSEGLLSDKEKVYINSTPDCQNFILSNNNLLMARTGATFAKVLLFDGDEPSVFASYLIRIKFNGIVDHKFYWYFSKSEIYWEQANLLSSGAAQPQFNGNALKQVIFTYPKSLPEQQRIVGILDEAFAAIAKAKANAEQNLKNAKELFESYLQGVFEKKGEGWEEKKLGEVCKFRNGAAHEQHIYEDGKYILVNSKYISSDGEKGKRTNSALSLLHVGDIAFVMSDVPNGKALAKCFLVDRDDTYTLNQRIGAIRSNLFDDEFLVYQFNRNKYLLGFNNGENQTNLRKNDILNCTLYLPKMEDQQTIIRKLDALRAETQKLEAVYQQKLADLEELKKSILQKAFAGELTDKSIAS